MAKEGVAICMLTDLFTLPPVCQYCILRKQIKKLVPKMQQGGRSEKLLEVVYADLTGPEDVPSAARAKYIMNLIDNLSGG